MTATFPCCRVESHHVWILPDHRYDKLWSIDRGIFRAQVLSSISNLNSVNRALELSIERLGVLPSGYSATSLLIFNEQGEMPAASGGMDVDAGPGTAVGAPLESRSLDALRYG